MESKSSVQSCLPAGHDIRIILIQSVKTLVLAATIEGKDYNLQGRILKSVFLTNTLGDFDDHTSWETLGSSSSALMEPHGAWGGPRAIAVRLGSLGNRQELHKACHSSAISDIQT